MECKNCGKNNSQAISEYVEIEKKPFPLILLIYLLLSILSITIGIVLITESCNHLLSEKQNFLEILFDTTITLIPYIIGKKLITYGITSILIIGLIRAFQPYQHETKTKIICLECGSVLYEKKTISDTDLEDF